MPLIPPLVSLGNRLIVAMLCCAASVDSLHAQAPDQQAAPTPTPSVAVATKIHEGEKLTPAQMAVKWFDANGNPLGFQEFKGQVVVIAFWAPGVTLALRALGPLTAIDTKYRGKGVRVVGVGLDVPAARKDVVPAVIKAAAIQFPMLIDRGASPEAFGINALPTIFIVDRNQRVARKYVTPASLQELERDVIRVLH